VVRELNDCFTAFDEITKRFHVGKLKTMGDGYLCVSGLVERQGSPAERILEAGFAMRNFIEHRNSWCRPAATATLATSARARRPNGG